MGIILGINHTEKCNSIFAVITDILMNVRYNSNQKNPPVWEGLSIIPAYPIDRYGCRLHPRDR